jgi:hypothetical protein
MNDFNRKVEDASARVSKTVAEAAESLEKEIPEFIKYLNDEVVPAVRSIRPRPCAWPRRSSPSSPTTWRKNPSEVATK